MSPVLAGKFFTTGPMQFREVPNALLTFGEADPNLSWVDLLRGTSWVKNSPKCYLITRVTLQAWHYPLGILFLLPPPTVISDGKMSNLVVKAPHF